MSLRTNEPRLGARAGWWSLPENLAIGTARISITITRKTDGDLIVSQTAIERWFVTEEEASAAMADIVTALNHVVTQPVENHVTTPRSNSLRDWQQSASSEVEPDAESISEDLKIK